MRGGGAEFPVGVRTSSVSECRIVAADLRQKYDDIRICSGVVRLRRSPMVVHEDPVHLIGLLYKIR